MSGSGKKQSAGGGGGGGDEEDGIDGPTKRGLPEEDSGGQHRCEREGKRVSLFRFRKAKKKVVQLQQQKRGRRRRGGGGLGNLGRFGRWVAGVGCCLCMKQPLTLDSSAESPTSDPNSDEFTYGMLRVLIEKNDFYAKECNPHLDAELVPSCSCSHRDEK